MGGCRGRPVDGEGKRNARRWDHAPTVAFPLGQPTTGRPRAHSGCHAAV